MGLLFGIIWLWYLVSVTVLGIISSNTTSAIEVFLSLFNVLLSLGSIALLFVVAVFSWRNASAALNPEYEN